MSNKPKFALAQATKIADGLQARMCDHVERMVIAGSVRREKPQVGDVEVLYIPLIRHEKVGLFDEMQNVNLTDLFLMGLLSDRRIMQRQNSTGSIMWGDKNKFAFHPASGMPIDFFATTRENWFVSLVVRTGSRETVLKLTTGAQKLGRTLNAYGAGVTGPDGSTIAATSERHVFELCGVPYVEPNQR